jgi:hypothetical protein
VHGTQDPPPADDRLPDDGAVTADTAWIAHSIETPPNGDAFPDHTIDVETTNHP